MLSKIKKFFSGQNRGVWSRIYGRSAGTRKAGRIRRILQRSASSLLTLFVAGTFCFGFAVPAIFADQPGRTLAGGLVDGRIVGGFSLAALVAVTIRFGMSSSANFRQGRRLRTLSTLSAIVKSLAFGVVTGAIALITQCPADTEAYLVVDDYDWNGDQYTETFIDNYAKRAKELKAKGFVVHHELEQLAKLAKGEENLKVSSVKSYLQLFSETHPDVTRRLAKLREKLKHRRGDVVLTFSTHRLPPRTPEMQAVWPLPPTISAEWLCANENADYGSEVDEVRVLSIWLSSDPMVRPLMRVTAESPATPPNEELTWKLWNASEALTDNLLDKKTLLNPLASTEGFQPGTSPQPGGGNRFSWQFELPRYTEKRWLTIDIAGASGDTHTWRKPIELHPNQIRTEGAAAAKDLVKLLPGFGEEYFPIVLGQKGTEKDGFVHVAVSGSVPDDQDAVVELVQIPVEALETVGDLEFSPAFNRTDLAGITVPPGLEKKWPTVPIEPPESWEILASVNTPDNKSVPTLYRKDPEKKPGHVTVHVPNAELMGRMNKDARLGVRHVVFLAFSLAERRGTSRRAWQQPYLLPRETQPLPLTSGRELEAKSLVSALLGTLVSGHDFSLRRSPGNSSADAISPAIPWGLLFVLGCTSMTVVIVATLVRKKAGN